ncbi:50S ribosomal protein L21 [candidate division WWE3 bacterium RIFCSPLOWO2_01_FULL_39_13]|uniref:Large ribosomal subunit protein bL21 n=1 Tax=candidate division WWE3 bacterium RIFCSPLOWO2_01_FULL_39_13 TaxID=1802624 RepID=A0A1F4V253_UNCKA|nr:MAG: 50S ribosomal protein L21 [candidate division WWE3 bacterium RIFCSPLOWO2_01_FULL_39_13]
MTDDNDFAVVKINSRQYLIQVGSSLKVDRINEKDSFAVLLCRSEDDLFIGEPEVTEAGVKIEIIDDILDKKIEVRRFRAKSRYRRHKGHRQPVTLLKVSEIKKGIKNQLIRIAPKKSKELGAKADDSSDKKKSTPRVAKVGKEDKKSVPATKDSRKVQKTGLDGLKISSTMKKHLKDAGFDTVEKIKLANKEDILKIKGIGSKAVKKLMDEVKNS